MKLLNKTIFITGASKGIGYELAKLLSHKENVVIIGARNKELLTEIKSKFPNLHTIYFDALDDNNIIKVKDELQDKFGEIDILINNSAVCYSYNFYNADVSFEKIETEIATNITSPIKVVKVFLPLLEKNTETAIVNITSGVAYLPMPSLPVYSATKSGLQSFTISLRESLRQTKIKVFEALPPLVETQMTENLIGYGKNMKKMSAEHCAKAIVKGIEDNCYTIKVGSSKSLFWGSKLFPSIVQKQLNKI
jgi:uncharacterized oxidoreductase